MAPRGVERVEKSHLRGERLPQEEEKGLEKCGNRRGIEKMKFCKRNELLENRTNNCKKSSSCLTSTIFFDYARIIETFMVS